MYRSLLFVSSLCSLVNSSALAEAQVAAQGPDAGSFFRFCQKEGDEVLLLVEVDVKNATAGSFTLKLKSDVINPVLDQKVTTDYFDASFDYSYNLVASEDRPVLAVDMTSSEEMRTLRTQLPMLDATLALAYDNSANTLSTEILGFECVMKAMDKSSPIESTVDDSDDEDDEDEISAPLAEAEIRD